VMALHLITIYLIILSVAQTTRRHILEVNSVRNSNPTQLSSMGRSLISTLKEEPCCSETTVNFYQTIRRHIPENSTLKQGSSLRCYPDMYLVGLRKTQNSALDQDMRTQPPKHGAHPTATAWRLDAGGAAHHRHGQLARARNCSLF
jgi:hypothetical protein